MSTSDLRGRPPQPPGRVRRVDAGPTPDRHPSVRWPDERRPQPRPVGGRAAPRSAELRRRMRQVTHPGPAPVRRPASGAGRWSPGPSPTRRPAPGPSSPAGAGRVRSSSTADLLDPWQLDDARLGSRTRPRRNRQGVEANARLTAMTGSVIFVLLAIEGLTILRVTPLLGIHVFVGMLMVPFVLVKIGSTTWRFAKYYLGNPEYRRRGPPPPTLRLIGPIVVVLTLAVLVSGIALLVAPTGWRTGLLLLHKVTFVVWLIFMALHVLGHIAETARLAPRDWLERSYAQVRGAKGRQWLLATAVVVGLVVAAVMLRDVGPWLALGRG